MFNWLLLGTGVVIKGYHIHVSDIAPEQVVAPGKYTFVEYFDPAVTSIPAFETAAPESDKFWIIIHLNSCYSELYQP